MMPNNNKKREKIVRKNKYWAKWFWDEIDKIPYFVETKYLVIFWLGKNSAKKYYKPIQWIPKHQNKYCVGCQVDKSSDPVLKIEWR